MSDRRRGYSAPPQRQVSSIGSFFGGGGKSQRLQPWDLDGAERGSGLGRGTGAGRASGLGARSGAGSARTQRARAPPRVYAQVAEPYDSEDEEERSAPAKRRRYRRYVVTILVLIYCSGAGTLLSIFVPQTCGLNSCRYKDTMCIDFEQCSVLQRATLIINFLTFGVTVWALLWFWTREKWLNTHLMRDVHLPDRNLPKSLSTYPVLRGRLDGINWRAYFAAQTLVGACLLNAALSAVMIYMERYAGGRSIFGYTMQSFLLLPQLLVTWQTAHESHHNGLALSLFRTAQVSYNILHPQYYDGKYFVSLEEQRAEAQKEEVHGAVVSRAAKYMQERLHVAERGKHPHA